MDFLPAASRAAADPLQKFFKTCFKLGHERKTPVKEYIPPTVLLPLAAVLALLPLIDHVIIAKIARPRFAKRFLFALALAAVAVQLASQAGTLWVNYAAYSRNISDAATFTECVLEAFHFGDVAVLDRYLLVLAAVRHALAACAAALYLTVLHRHYFLLPAVPRIAWTRGLKLFLLYAFALALPALTLLLPSTPDEHGCRYDGEHDRYVCSVLEWEQLIGKPSRLLGSSCDAETSTAIAADRVLGCGWRPSRRIMRGLGERLLQATLSADVVLPRLFATLVLTLCALGVTFAALTRASRARRAPQLRLLTPLLRGSTLALFATHAAAWLFLDLAIVHMLRLARGAVSCGCAHDAVEKGAVRAALVAAGVVVADGMKLLAVFMKREGSGGAGAGGVTDERTGLLDDGGAGEETMG